MTLVDDIKEWFGGENRNPYSLADDLDCVVMQDEIVNTTRWAELHEIVYLRKTVATVDPLTFTEEYAMVESHQPSGEVEDWSGFLPPDVYPVAPVEVTITQYHRL